jgi:hypothetical protein
VSPKQERRPQPRTARLLLRAFALAAAAAPAATAPPSALQACASIAADADRLACYDRLAGRAVASVPGHAATAVAPPAAASAPVAGVAAAAPPPATASAPVAGVAAAAPPATPVPPPKESFGLYEAEHPKPAPVASAPSLEARVVALGKSANGHMIVSLEGGAVWELDDSDPLLAVGETVTITRATFRSYIMHTPSKRTHRAHRLS